MHAVTTLWFQILKNYNSPRILELFSSEFEAGIGP